MDFDMIESLSDSEIIELYDNQGSEFIANWCNCAMYADKPDGSHITGTFYMALDYKCDGSVPAPTLTESDCYYLCCQKYGNFRYVQYQANLWSRENGEPATSTCVGTVQERDCCSINGVWCENRNSYLGYGSWGCFYTAYWHSRCDIQE